MAEPYKPILKPISKNIKNEMAIMPWSYSHLLAIANLLYYLHEQMDKLEDRFVNYPAEQFEEIHQEIYDICCDRIAAMNAAWKAGNNGE